MVCSGVWVKLRAATISGMELIVMELTKIDKAMIIFSQTLKLPHIEGYIQHIGGSSEKFYSWGFHFN